MEYVDNLRLWNYLPEDSPAFYSLDGEEIQLRNIMNRIQIFNNRNIIMAKRAASLSQFGNALDAGNIHKATKKRQKFMTDMEAHHAKDGIIAAILGHLRSAIPTLTKAKSTHIAEACVRVASAFQFTLAPSMILHSFEKCAQTLPSSLEAKLALYPLAHEITLSDMSAMEEAFENHVKIVRTTGKITEEIMDEASIPITLNNDRRQKPKDERVLHQQRSCILNGEAVINHYNIYIQKKQDLALKRLQSGRAVKRDQKHSNEGPSVCPSPKNQPKKRSSRWDGKQRVRVG